MSDVYLVPGLPTPFVEAGGLFGACRRSIIADPGISNIARELVFEAGLDATIRA